MSWTCLITGASRGIGAALALKLAKPGRTIGINYASSDAAAAAVAKAVEAKGAKALLLKADVSGSLEGTGHSTAASRALATLEPRLRALKFDILLPSGQTDRNGWPRGRRVLA